MAHIYDIKGGYDPDYGYNYLDKNNFEGQIIIYENGWIEGIVKDNNNALIEKRFVFGVICPEAEINLISSPKYELGYPIIYRGYGHDKTFRGNAYQTTKINEFSIGSDIIEIAENNHIMTEDFEKIIDNFKKIIDAKTKQIYLTSFQNQEYLLEGLRKKQHGQIFSNEDFALLAGLKDEDNFDLKRL